MNYVKIGTSENDAREYDVIVTELIENFNILYSENTGRTISTGAKMTLDPLGTFRGYKITFARKQGQEEEYDRLFDFVSEPRYDGIWLEAVHNQTVQKAQFYISSGERVLKRIDENTGKVYWDKLTLNIVPMEAQVLPK
jgi:hypothetical protein